MSEPTRELPLSELPPNAPTIYVMQGPARKDGSPVLGNFGARIGEFVIMDVATWKRLCADHPTLAQTKFRVGSL